MDPLIFLFLSADDAPEPPPEEAPGAPGNLTIVAIGSDSVQLSWDAPTTGGDPDEYVVEGADNATFSSPGDFSAVVGSTGHTFLSADIDPETTYWFRVLARNSAGSSGYSNVVTDTTSAAGAPDAPTNVSAVELTSTSIRITWTDQSSDEDGFRIYRAKDGGAFAAIDTTAANVETYDDTGLDPAGEYCYRVVSFLSAAESGVTGTSCVENLGALGAPTGLTADPISDTQVDLEWTITGSPTGHEILVDGVVVDTVGGGASSAEVTGLSEVTSYAFTVRSLNGTAASPESNEVTQATRLTTPTSFNYSAVGSGPTGFTRFTWDDATTNNDEYVLLKDGGVYRSLSATATQTDVVNSDNGEFVSWTLEARHAAHLSSQAAGPLLGFPPE